MIVRDGQNIFDLTCQGTGNINNLFSVLYTNDLSADCYLISGQNIKIPQTINIIDNFIISFTETLNKVTQYLIKNSQNLFDVTCQFFGDISQFINFCSDNSLEFDKILSSGMIVQINNYLKGNETFKRFITNNKLILCNEQGVNYKYLETENSIIITTENGQPIIIEG